MIANNRVGEEVYEKSRIRFYGGSFISGQHGEVLAQVRVSGCLQQTSMVLSGFHRLLRVLQSSTGWMGCACIGITGGW